ncbi:hypothetical protein AMECASPLE_032875, partial [Ameca splendens]
RVCLSENALRLCAVADLLAHLCSYISQISHPEPEPMQIGHTRLSPEEWQRRFEAKACLYCSSQEHFKATCPVRPKERVCQ